MKRMALLLLLALITGCGQSIASKCYVFDDSYVTSDGKQFVTRGICSSDKEYLEAEVIAIEWAHKQTLQTSRFQVVDMLCDTNCYFWHHEESKP